MNRYNSTLRNIKFGIPHGYILGILLFSFSHHISNVEVALVADDINMLVTDRNTITLRGEKRLMIHLESWFSLNNLVIILIRPEQCFPIK
jgi:hypothetical protein